VGEEAWRRKAAAAGVAAAVVAISVGERPEAERGE